MVLYWKEIQKRRSYRYKYSWFNLLCSRNLHNTVKQLYSKKNFKIKIKKKLISFRKPPWLTLPDWRRWGRQGWGLMQEAGEIEEQLWRGVITLGCRISFPARLKWIKILNHCIYLPCISPEWTGTNLEQAGNLTSPGISRGAFIIQSSPAQAAPQASVCSLGHWCLL